MKNHFLLLAEVRWQIFQNSLADVGKRWELAARIVTLLLASVGALGFGLALGAGSYSALLRGRLILMALVFWGLFAMWHGLSLAMGAFSGLNFREIARYPVSFRLYYLLDTAYGLLDPATVTSLFWLGCMWLGIALARPAVAYPVLPLFAVFALVNLLIHRVLYYFFEKLTSTRRGRERLFIAFMILLMLPQILVMTVGPGESLQRFSRALLQAASPPGLIAQGILGPMWIPLLGLIAYSVVAALVLRRQLWRNYRGEVFSEGRLASFAVQAQPGWKLPLVSETLSAVVEKEARYALHEPALFLSLLAAPLVAGMMNLQTRFQSPIHLPMSPESFYPWIVGSILLSLGMRAYNSFCFEGHGFAQWVLAPIDLRSVLLGKNLVLGSILALSLAGVTLVSSISGDVSLLRAAIVSAGFLYASLTITGAGNFFSVWRPGGIDIGTMRSKNISQLAVLGSLSVQCLILGSLGLVFYLARRWNLDWLPFPAFLVLIAVALKFYLFSLDAASKYARNHSEEIAAKLV